MNALSRRCTAFPAARAALATGALAALLSGGLAAQMAGAGSEQADAAVEAAEARVAEARAEKQAAFDAVEALILDLSDDYAAFTTDADAPSTRHALVLAMVDALPTAQTRLVAERSDGRPVQRGTRRLLLTEAFTGPVSAASPVDERFSGWLAAQAAAELSRRTDFADISADDVLAAITDLFGNDHNWYEFWNEHFRIGLPEVDRHREAELAYEQAGLELNRLRFPERYGPKGEPAPPGMVVVAGGSYTLGPSTGWELPEHKATLKSFAIDRAEVTQRQYALFVDALGRRADKEEMLPRGWGLGSDDRAAYDTARSDHPVVYVSYEQAAAYAAWAGKRLPTESEWEAAAAGFERRIFPWGKFWSDDAANGADTYTGTLPAGSYPQARSPAGCLDMSGNVWEWTTTLDNGKDFDELPEGLVNVAIRGGAFNSSREQLTARYRWAAPGRDTFASSRYSFPIGFRCVKDLR